MKEMSRLQPGMGFYGEMPDMYNLVLNADHPLVAKLLEGFKAEAAEALKPFDDQLKGLNARRAAIEQTQKDRKAEEITDQEREDLRQCNADIEQQQAGRNKVFADYAEAQPVVSQLIDLALLQNGLLRGEALSNFVKRSIALIK